MNRPRACGSCRRGFRGRRLFGEDLDQQLEGILSLGAGCLGECWGDLADAAHLQGSGEESHFGGETTHQQASSIRAS